MKTTGNLQWWCLLMFIIKQASFLLLLFILGSCANMSEKSPNDKRQSIQSMREDVLTQLFKAKPALRSEIKDAPGYAVFSNVNVNIIFASFSGGIGVAKNMHSGQYTYMRMGEVGLGLGLGVKDFRAVFVFHTKAAFNRFIKHGWSFGGHADAAAKVLEQGLAAGVEAIIDDATVYQITESGLALQASLKGTKFWKDDELNDDNQSSLFKSGPSKKTPVVSSSQHITDKKNRSFANLELLEKYFKEGKFIPGLQKSETIFIVKEHKQLFLKKQGQLIEGLAQSIISQNDRDKALKKVEILLMNTSNDSSKSLYQTFIKKQTKQQYTERAKRSFDNNNYIDTALIVIEYIQNNQSATQSLDRMAIEDSLIDKLHEQALKLYRNHHLDKALYSWQLIQQIQPDNELSNKYIQRTQQMIKKLKQY